MRVQNKFILGFMSFMVLAGAGLFVSQPTVAHADALAQIQPDSRTGDIVMFGGINLTSGQPESGVYIAVAATRDGNGGWLNGRHKGDRPEILASTTTGSDGRFKLWIQNEDARSMRPGTMLTIMLRPHNSKQTYQEDINLRPGDVASVSIAMRTPLIPIFPFTVFVY